MKKSLPAKHEPATKNQPVDSKPLKPRPKLLLITSILMALWIIFLLVMYFTTVFPHRKG